MVEFVKLFLGMRTFLHSSCKFGGLYLLLFVQISYRRQSYNIILNCATYKLHFLEEISMIFLFVFKDGWLEEFVGS